MSVLACLIWISWSWTCEAQTVEYVKSMPDGSHIVLVDGKRFRAFSPEKVESLANQKDELEVCKANEIRFEDKIKISEQNVTIANQKAQIHETNFRHAMQMYTTERELRQEASQFLPHGKVGGFGGKVLNFLDGPWSQAFWKIAVPTIQVIRAK